MAGLVVGAIVVVVVAAALWTRAAIPGPVQAEVTPEPSMPSARATPQLVYPVHIDEVLGLADRRFQIRFTALLGVLGAPAPYTWRVLATNAVDESAAPLAQGTDRDAGRSFTVTLPCGGFNAAYTAALLFDSPAGRTAPAGIVDDTVFTVPASCPQLTAAIQGGESWEPDRRGRTWSTSYRVSITNTSGPVTWTQIAYRRGVPNDPGTLRSTTPTAPSGEATIVGPSLTCAELLKYSRWRLVATDRLGVAGWWDIGLPEACPPSVDPSGP
jgi:hypothetical protein